MENKNILPNLLEMLKQSIKPILNSELSKLAKQMIDSITDYVSNTAEHFGADIEYKETEVLDKNQFLEYAQKCVVDGANGIAALYAKNKNIIYFAGVNNDELLPKDKNRYIVISAKYVTDDVKVFFENEDLIILN